MKTSESISDLTVALAKAQAVLRNPSKDSLNPHFKSKYAGLDTGLNITRECLSAHGIAFTQSTRLDGNLLVLETRLMLGNQWMESDFPVCNFPMKPQDMGSALSYAKRYSLFALVGIVGENENDDDANAANKYDIRVPKTNAPAPKREAPPKREAVAATAFTADESAAVLAQMKVEIANCSSRAELRQWSEDNAERKSRLLHDHKDECAKAFYARLDEIKAGDVPAAAE